LTPLARIAGVIAGKGRPRRCPMTTYWRRL
jgi:hypothetical protein